MANKVVNALPPAVDGTLKQLDNRAGPLKYYVAGQGTPILLLHSVNAAASVYEVKPLFDGLKSRYRTYAVDLPGFGMSDRSERTYDVRLFVDAVLDMLDVIASDTNEEPAGPDGPAPVHVVALSLASEFAARAATEMPSRFRSLTMITPTGFSRGSANLRQAGATKEIPGLSAVLRFPLWRGPLYGLLVGRGSIRFFLEKTFGSKNINEGMFEYAYKTAQQPGADRAPYAFLSGRLFSKDIRTILRGAQSANLGCPWHEG